MASSVARMAPSMEPVLLMKPPFWRVMALTEPPWMRASALLMMSATPLTVINSAYINMHRPGEGDGCRGVSRRMKTDYFRKFYVGDQIAGNNDKTLVQKALSFLYSTCRTIIVVGGDIMHTNTETGTVAEIRCDNIRLEIQKGNYIIYSKLF